MTLVRAVWVVCLVLGVVLLGLATTVAVVPLPAPAAGGTCGPGASSESAIVAFFDPVSIGAGPEPAPASATRPQWEAFVNECQSASDTRMTVAGAVVLGFLLVVFGIPSTVRRYGGRIPAAPAAAPAGWYPDPADPRLARWWDGGTWGPLYTPVPSPWPSHGGAPPIAR
jgi:hypothetical protein